ncbi:NYN domain-containing protein [Orrella daihaiensis]|uniref:NYN domain-containing protein n=1 Tax=Orrella daihaiensis TaxID=2782176 RepID=A0ABY4AKU2_9BURK|nr:NYN domain-containing protein [Orrella daihaiensis]UOD50261.1 NYN domain-containing protein [Orrella daihaiensis]
MLFFYAGQTGHRNEIKRRDSRKMYPERIAVVEGKILASTPYQRLVKPIDNASHLKLVQVYDFNEKKTDVNLAADLITGAWTGAYEQAVVCSNDTDLEAALAAVRNYHHDIRLGLVAPIPGHDHRRISTDLSKHAHWSKPLSPVHLQAAQLPDRIPHSTLRKPESW